MDEVRRPKDFNLSEYVGLSCTYATWPIELIIIRKVIADTIVFSRYNPLRADQICRCVITCLFG